MADEWTQAIAPYKKNDAVSVTCLNRTIDTGEHIADSHGQLQYIPFPDCKESAGPLTFHYLRSTDQNCTITLTDPLFHLLEFYIHNDAPLTCRLPTYHTTRTRSEAAIKGGTANKDATANALDDNSFNWVPLPMGLSGTLQRSHLHVANELNVVVHTAGADEYHHGKTRGNPFTGNDIKKMLDGKKKIGAVDSAAAYSISPLTKNKRIVIGDELTFEFHIRWFEGNGLPSKGIAVPAGGSSLLGPLVFGMVAGFGLCYFWLRMKGLKQQEILPKYNGYGYGVGIGASGAGPNGGFGRTGKRD